VLVIDEVGYLTYGTDAANMLFHVVNDRHKRRRAMILELVVLNREREVVVDLVPVLHRCEPRH
jgi:DNA replication protein DnaC